MTCPPESAPYSQTVCGGLPAVRDCQNRGRHETTLRRNWKHPDLRTRLAYALDKCMWGHPYFHLTEAKHHPILHPWEGFGRQLSSPTTCNGTTTSTPCVTRRQITPLLTSIKDRQMLQDFGQTPGRICIYCLEPTHLKRISAKQKPWKLYRGGQLGLWQQTIAPPVVSQRC